jgi:imidazolonepropionase-like amidohydrolase
MGLVAHGPEELRAAVRELVDEDVDFVKVMATGGMLTVGSDPYTAQYSESELAALVEEAHGRGRRVAAHVLCAAGLRAALGAGVDTVEHGWTITGRPQDRDDALTADIVAAGTFMSVTAHTALRTLLEEGDLAELRRRLDAHRRLRQAGATVLVHSDAGTPGTTFGEFALSVEAFARGLGTTPAEAIEAATSIPAAALGLEHEIGSVEAGRRADLLVLRGDVSSDLRALREVERVFQDGRSVVADGRLSD